MTVTRHLNLPTLDQSCRSRKERAALFRSYTWHFSTQGLPAAAVASNNCGLLPHFFTLIQPKRDGYFLWHFLVSPLGESPAVSGIRCSILSGLSLALMHHDSTACSNAKVIVIISGALKSKYMKSPILKIDFSSPIPVRRIVLIDKRFYFSF